MFPPIIRIYRSIVGRMSKVIVDLGQAIAAYQLSEEERGMSSRFSSNISTALGSGSKEEKKVAFKASREDYLEIMKHAQFKNILRHAVDNIEYLPAHNSKAASESKAIGRLCIIYKQKDTSKVHDVDTLNKKIMFIGIQPKVCELKINAGSRIHLTLRFNKNGTYDVFDLGNITGTKTLSRSLVGGKCEESTLTDRKRFLFYKNERVVLSAPDNGTITILPKTLYDQELQEDSLVMYSLPEEEDPEAKQTLQTKTLQVNSEEPADSLVMYSFPEEEAPEAKQTLQTKTLQVNSEEPADSLVMYSIPRKSDPETLQASSYIVHNKD
jgi:hypothetical protein